MLSRRPVCLPWLGQRAGWQAPGGILSARVASTRSPPPFPGVFERAFRVGHSRFRFASRARGLPSPRMTSISTGSSNDAGAYAKDREAPQARQVAARQERAAQGQALTFPTVASRRIEPWSSASWRRAARTGTAILCLYGEYSLPLKTGPGSRCPHARPCMLRYECNARLSIRLRRRVVLCD